MPPDNNLRSFVGPQDDGVHLTDIQLDGTGYDDALKCSNLRNALFARLAIIGGKEDCCDVNRGANLKFKHCQLIPIGRFACTLKGGASNLTFEDIVLSRHGTETDFDFGGWSDQAQSFGARTTGVTLRRVRMDDGSPIRIRVLNAERPTIEDCGPVKLTVVPRVAVWFWWTFRRNNLIA